MEQVQISTVSVGTGGIHYFQVRLPGARVTGLQVTSPAIPYKNGDELIPEGRIAFVQLRTSGALVYEGEIRFQHIMRTMDGFPRSQRTRFYRGGGGVNLPLKVNIPAHETTLFGCVRAYSNVAPGLVHIYIHYQHDH